MYDASDSSASEGFPVGKTNGNALCFGIVSGESHTSTLMTAGTRSTGSAARQIVPAQRQTTSRAVVVDAKTRHQTHAIVASCAENVERALDNDVDFVLRSNALAKVQRALADLWAVRSGQDEAYAELVNLLQGVFAERDLESFTEPQLDVLHSVFVKLRDEPAFDDAAANRVTAELLRGGIDVFRELD